MPQITFILPDGQQQIVTVQSGGSLMEAALNHGVDGIVADCGGACTCATCHVYVAPDWTDKLAPPLDIEEVMLDFVGDRQPTSRLSCQIGLTNALDGLTVEVPSSQA